MKYIFFISSGSSDCQAKATMHRTAHYAALMMPYEKPASQMKSVRRDEVARLYGVSESVKNIFSPACKTIYALRYNERRGTVMCLCRKSGIKDLKETFWLLLWIWIKVTRSAERNKGRACKAFECNLNSASG